MCKPENNLYSEPECADSLIRAVALEREITDLWGLDKWIMDKGSG